MGLLSFFGDNYSEEKQSRKTRKMAQNIDLSETDLCQHCKQLFPSVIDSDDYYTDLESKKVAANHKEDQSKHVFFKLGSCE